MSATNRGRERNERDLYETPAWVTRAILPHLDLSGWGTIWEPACGNGAIVRELIRHGVHPERIIASDISPGEMPNGVFVRTADIGSTSQAPSPSGRVWMAITNPPFRIPIAKLPPVGGDHPQPATAERNRRDGVLNFVSCADRAGAAVIVVLCRVNWWTGGQGRVAARAWLRERYSVEIYTMAKRPSFTGRGTDATEYAWIVFQRHTSALGVLPEAVGRQRDTLTELVIG